jgi:hypothetical protein
MKTITVVLDNGDREIVEAHDEAQIELHLEYRYVSIAMPEEESKYTHVWWGVQSIKIDRDQASTGPGLQ